MRLQPLIVPGWNGSGPDHWQSQWEAMLPRAQRVEQRDWRAPDRTEWTLQLSQSIDACARPPLLIAHSLGCITVAHLSFPVRQKVAAALLVAPADVERPGAPAHLASFAPVPRTGLGFPSIVVASTNDPYCSLARAHAFAEHWGSEIVVLESAGHINADSGLGDWPQGQRLLASLRRRCRWRIPGAPAHRIAAMPATTHD